jgi:hypothetical protein
MGCPTNAKQSMLVTTIPAALDRGATLLVQTRAQTLELAGARAGLHCMPVAINGTCWPVPGTRVVARHFVVAGGAINSPALLMRSKLPDPHGRLGQRTFLHPVTLCTACSKSASKAGRARRRPVHRPLPGHGAHRRPHRLQARSAAPAPGDRPLTMAGFGDSLEKALKAFPTRRRCWRCCAMASTPSRRWPGQGCCATARRCSTTGSRLS